MKLKIKPKTEMCGVNPALSKVNAALWDKVFDISK